MTANEGMIKNVLTFQTKIWDDTDQTWMGLDQFTSILHIMISARPAHHSQISLKIHSSIFQNAVEGPNVREAVLIRYQFRMLNIKELNALLPG